MVHRRRDEVGSDQAVGRRPADEEAAAEEPEVTRADPDLEAAKCVHDRAAGRERDVVGLGRAVGAQPEVAWAVAEKYRDHRHDGERGQRDRDRGHSPAEVLRHPAERGQEDQLPGGARRGQCAQDQTAALHEPATGHRRREHRRHAAGAEAHDNSPEQVELPGRVHHRGQQRSGGHRRQRAHRHLAEAEAVHEGGRERSRQAEQNQID